LHESILEGKTCIEDEFTTIFNPIQTALKKASLTKDEIDYVLFIGGSSKNPYVQAALKEHFKESELLVPRDLQTHVSSGAAIYAAIETAKRLGKGANVLAVVPSNGERYLSTPLYQFED